jgi:hypothetical protein
MSSDNLGRLQRVDLRAAWPSESAQFTPWLGKSENLRLLGETIGIELDLECEEKEVGPFRADLLCKDTTNDHWVLIENQLERTNHDHLGKLLTYAAGLDAVTIVWIAERFTEEHRAALDWLNEHTDENIMLFGLEIELWRIGDSPFAPKFNIVCQPNDWSRSVRLAAAGEITEHKQLQLNFWTAFREYMNERSSIRCQKPSPQHWMVHTIGKSGVHLSSITSMWNSETKNSDPEIRVELTLNGRNAKHYFNALEQRREEIESAVGRPLKWHNPETKNACRIYTRMNADFTDASQWREQHEWLRTNLETFYRVFSPIVKAFE